MEHHGSGLPVVLLCRGSFPQSILSKLKGFETSAPSKLGVAFMHRHGGYCPGASPGPCPGPGAIPVSYTHLTLPTICSV
eukprot:559424-Karenia_brevis.AAC.1